MRSCTCMCRSLLDRHRLASVVLVLAVGACDKTVVTEAEPAAAEKSERQTPRAEAPRPVPEPAEAPDRPTADLPRTLDSFEDVVAKAGELHGTHRRTFYCGCMYTKDERVARGTCGYQTRADEDQAKRIAWERIVPVRSYGATRPCWSAQACTSSDGTALSGVACCLQTDPVFSAMHHDLHNVVPAVAELTQDRSNFEFGEIEGEERLYGSCDFEIDRSAAVAEPPAAIRGDIARAYLYMQAVYGDALTIEPAKLQMLRSWHAEDPPDDWERERSAAIAAIQGRPNPFVGESEQSPKVAAKEPASDEGDDAEPESGGRLESMLRAGSDEGAGADGQGPATASQK